MKKLVTFFLALVMPIMLWAYDFQLGDLYYNITSDVAPYTVEVTNPKSSSLSMNFRSVTIPATVEYNNVIYTVTRIGDMAFYLPEFGFFLTSITIPNTVTSIGDYAFCGSVLLTSIIIPNSVTSIGVGAFRGCWGMSSLVLESGNIVYDSRENCNAIIETATNTLIAGVNSSIIPNSVTTIGSHAFYRCEYLTSVTLPNSVTSIGDHAFSGCKSLSSITIPNSVTNIGDNAFSGCKSLSSITLPNSVTNIGDYAFSGCDSLSSIIIPNSVTSIGDGAFDGCESLSSIIIPNSVTSIGDGAFNGCESLSSITIPNSVESIGGGAFFATGFYLDENNWKNELLYCCNCLIAAKDSIWGSHVIESNTRMIADWVFTNRKSLSSIIIPNSVTSIGDGAFDGCESLSSIIIPNSVTSIGDDTFGDCFSLTSVTIPSSVTSIGSYAFYNCSSLTSVTIPNSVESIGKAAFINCRNLDTIYVEATTPPTLGANAFRSSPSPTFYIPCGTKAAYEASDWASQVSKFVEDCIEGQQIKYTSTDDNIVTPYATDVFGANIISNTYKDGVGTITFDAPVTSLGDLAFHQCSSLVSVTIPNTVTSIGDRAFWNCSSLSSITIPNGVESIGEFAFYYCSSLNAITLPNSVKTIGRDAFGYCSSLKKTNYIGDVKDWCDIVFITRETNPIYYSKSFYINDQEVKDLVIPNEVDSIHDYAFENCQSITSLTIGDGVKYIGTEAFSGCFSLKDVKMGKNIVDIGKQAFLSCSSLAVINIPTSVKTIGYQAFSHCRSLTEVEIPNNVTTIGHMAFSMCDSIVSVSLPQTLTSLGRLAFYECYSLSTITVEEGNAKYDSRGNCNAVIETATNTLLVGSASTIIPEGIISIETAAFRGRQALTSINIPNSVTNIGEDAFYGCPLTSITIPQNVTNIGELAFRACWSLETVYVEAYTPPTLGNNAFEANSPTCYIPCGTKTAYEASDWANYMGEFVEDCIEGQQIKYTSTDGNIVTPNKTDVFGANIVSNTYENGVGTITFDGPVTSIGFHAFSGCSSLTSITIPNGVRRIGDFVFKDCSSLASMVVESGNTTYDSRDNCNAIIETATNTLIAGCQNTIVPNSVTSIGDGAFRGHSSLTSITIPNSVTSIGNGAFYYCSSLDTIYVEATTPPTLVGGVFKATPSPTCIIPCGTLAAYQASDWANYVGEFVETYEYTLTLSSLDNSMGSATITQEPACGTPAIIVATPNAGYLFSQWSDGNTDNPRTLSVTEDMKLTAQWTLNTNIPYIVNHYRQALDGTYPSALMETENLTGTTATNVTPLVKTYTGFTSPVAKTAIIAADGSTVVEYYYTRNQYTLTWVTDGNALTGAYSKGSVLFEAAITRPNTPTKTGYTFAGWDNTVPATMPAENLTLTALFTIHTYSVILTADQNGTVSGGGTYNYGESVTITATPNDGYTFSQWSDGNTDNPRTLTVTEDIELTAEFEEVGNYGSYSRTVRIGYNTICLPHGSSHFTGATFYEIAHILKNKKKIFFDEVKTLEAGKPYIFYPHNNEVTIYYDNTTSAIPLSHNGLHGTFDGITAASNFLKGKYLVAGDRMVLCGDGCSLAANRAYIELDEISDKDHPAIPGIKRVSMDYSEENATTALDNITDESIVAPMQEGVYDILGRKVDAPTVSGFYIINGKKVFVMEK